MKLNGVPVWSSLGGPGVESEGPDRGRAQRGSPNAHGPHWSSANQGRHTGPRTEVEMPALELVNSPIAECDARERLGASQGRDAQFVGEWKTAI